jgi:hypothetical protein
LALGAKIKGVVGILISAVNAIDVTALLTANVDYIYDEHSQRTQQIVTTKRLIFTT